MGGVSGFAIRWVGAVACAIRARPGSDLDGSARLGAEVLLHRLLGRGVEEDAPRRERRHSTALEGQEGQRAYPPLEGVVDLGLPLLVPGLREGVEPPGGPPRAAHARQPLARRADPLEEEDQVPGFQRADAQRPYQLRAQGHVLIQRVAVSLFMFGVSTLVHCCGSIKHGPGK